MFVQENMYGGSLRLLACLGAVAIVGCGSTAGNVTGGSARPTLGLSPSEFDDGSAFYEAQANDLLESPEVVDLSNGPRVIRGHIAARGDVDVYDLGPVVPGDRVVVDTSVDESLKAAIGLFDGAGASLLINDHRNVYLGKTVPFVDVVIRRSSDTCLVAVASTPDARSSGDYALMASILPATAIPSPRPDVILLDFDGADDVRIGGRPGVQVPFFDAATIDPVYAGATANMIELIVAAVRDDFVWADTTILSTSEGDEMSGSMSRLFFGSFDSALLGVAEGVDEFNATRAQQAIVFTDTFAAFLPLNPSTQEMARAIANVASHEIGHLLGLVHTEDPSGIMDVTASLRDLMRDQAFRVSGIYPAVFPIGDQNAVQYLLDAVGGDPVLAMETLRELKERGKVIAEPSGPPARDLFYLSTCGLESSDEH